MKVGETYRHYKGGLYELLHVASENIHLYQPFSVVLKSIDTGLIYTVPVSSFAGRVFSGSNMIKRFELLVDDNEAN